jgi:diaminopimelate epimerase
MIGQVVHKMTGSGNDFVFIDGRFAEPRAWTPDLVRAVCDRRSGVGGDGLVVVEPCEGHAGVRMTYFNRDGSRAPMCGNAALCATRFAASQELAPAEGMVLETEAGTYRARCVPGTESLAELELGDVSSSRAVEVRLSDGESVARLAIVGVPHLVVLVPDVDVVRLPERGASLRHDQALGPGGANVNFFSCGPEGWAMRTYERGVEDETLACGTGAVAGATVLSELKAVGLPWTVRTRSGCNLVVNGVAGICGLKSVRLVGEGRLVFRGALGNLP